VKGFSSKVQRIGDSQLAVITWRSKSVNEHHRDYHRECQRLLEGPWCGCDRFSGQPEMPKGVYIVTSVTLAPSTAQE
jgi:hypothetical protein